MKNNIALKLVAISLLAISSFPSQANGILYDLYDWGFNIDGTTYCNEGPCDFDGLTPAGLPSAIDASAFDFLTGFGTINISINTVGSHNVLTYVDHDLYETGVDANTYFNENGGSSGTVAAGQSWEIDEPGFGSDPNAPYQGDIFNNFVDNTLDNRIFYDGFFDEYLSDYPGSPDADDVSMALGWDFSLAADETALVSFFISGTAPQDIFFLTHTDPDSNVSLHYWSTLSIAAASVPAPSSLALFGIGLIGLAGISRRLTA